MLMRHRGMLVIPGGGKLQLDAIAFLLLVFFIC